MDMLYEHEHAQRQAYAVKVALLRDDLPDDCIHIWLIGGVCLAESTTDAQAALIDYATFDAEQAGWGTATRTLAALIGPCANMEEARAANRDVMQLDFEHFRDQIAAGDLIVFDHIAPDVVIHD